jgi:hypothetical protein
MGLISSKVISQEGLIRARMCWETQGFQHTRFSRTRGAFPAIKDQNQAGEITFPTTPHRRFTH